MEHLAQDLSIALEESESCGPINTADAQSRGGKWGMRRRTRSAGNLHIYVKSGEEDSSSSNSEIQRLRSTTTQTNNLHHSDSDDMSLSLAVRHTLNNRTHSLRMKQHPIHHLLKGRYRKLGVSHSLESDSFNEHSPARPSIRRKRKLKRMSVDETTPVPPIGKRKRPQRNVDILENVRNHHHRGGVVNNGRIKPLHQSVVEKIEKFCQPLDVSDCNRMETQYVNDCELNSESSISWSGEEGHEGDDELTDWAPSQDPIAAFSDQPFDNDSREFRAGCRRLGDERPGFSINTSANERVARFLQDTGKMELRLCGAEREKLSQLAALYSLELWFESPTTSLLRKTTRTPFMQPTQRHHAGHTAGHKRIRTQDQLIT